MKLQLLQFYGIYILDVDIYFRLQYKPLMFTKESYRNSITNNLEGKKGSISRRQFFGRFLEASVFFNAAKASKSAINLAVDNQEQIPESVANLPKKVSEKLKDLDSNLDFKCKNTLRFCTEKDDLRVNRKHPLGYSQDNTVRFERAVKKYRTTKNITDIAVGGSMIGAAIVFANDSKVSRRDILKRAAEGGLSGGILRILKSLA